MMGKMALKGEQELARGRCVEDIVGRGNSLSKTWKLKKKKKSRKPVCDSFMSVQTLSYAGVKFTGENV